MNYNKTFVVILNLEKSNDDYYKRQIADAKRREDNMMKYLADERKALEGQKNKSRL